MAGEEVTISVVFTDLVGSTELSSRLGPQASEELRQVHFGLLREATAAHGGTEVKNLGDGLMVVFPSLGKALDGAVAMQQGIGRHNDKGGEHLGIRVGISTGDATEEDADYFGEPVVEAARLCAKCSAGQILAGDTVRALSKRSSHVFRSIGELELKGLPEPVEAYEVAWEPAAPASAVPLPTRLAEPTIVDYVGRAAERDVLNGLWKAVGTGERRVALLAGEPGVGKTRLSTEVAGRAHGEGAVVLYGRCDEDLGLPYQPFVEALSHYVEHGPVEVLEQHVARHGGELARLVPRLSDRVAVPELQRTDPETERYLLFGAVAALLGTASTGAPVLLVLDDLHWADKQTILLLKHLIKSPTGMSLLVIGTYRDTDLSATDAMVDLLADLRRESTVERIPLAGLDDREVVAFLEQMADHEMPPEGVALGHAIRRRTAGNPFFIGELLRQLAESGAIALGDDGRWVATVDVADMALPESVKEVVGRRVRRLSAAAFRALSVASVVGRQFDLATLCTVDGADEDEVLDALEEAERAAIVAEDPGADGAFHFVSTLIQQTLYEELSATRRSRMHRRVAEALEQVWGADPGDHIGELAHHWMAAVQPADIAKAIDYARQAGVRALEKLAPDEAGRWFRAALELVDGSAHAEEATRADLLLGLGQAQRESGDPDFRETLLGAAALAQRLGDHDRLVRAALLNNRGEFSSAGRVDAERVAVLEAALAAMPDAPSAERARVLGLLAMELLYAGDYDRRRAISDEAVAVAREVGDPATLGQVLVYRQETLRVPETVTERLELMAEARALLPAADDQLLSFWVHSFSMHALVESGDIAGVHEQLVAAREIATAIGQPVLDWQASFHEAWEALLAGDPVQAEALADAALAIGTDAGEPDAFAIYGGQLLCIRWHQGRLDELIDLLDGAAAETQIAAYKGAHAMALAEAGRTDDVADRIGAEMAAGWPGLHPDNVWLVGVVSWAEAAAHTGHRAAAEHLLAILEAYPEQVATTGASVHGPVAHQIGILHRTLGHLDEAIASLATARRIAEAVRGPFFVSRADLELGATLLQRGGVGDAEEAIRRLTAARALAGTHGCVVVERRAGELLDGAAS